jgi:hypothetical protein
MVLLKELCHRPHRRARVGEDQFQACTKVVLSRVSLAREYEPLLRTTAVAKRPDLATLALLSE